MPSSSTNAVSSLHGKFFVVDTFTSKAHGGNPATVLFFDPAKYATSSFAQQESSASSLTSFFQRLAQDIATVEVAVILPPVQTKTDFALRFFTKSGETPNCGHASVAAAAVIMKLIPEFRGSKELYFTIGNFISSSASTVKPGTNVVIRRVADGRLYELSSQPSVPVQKEMSVDDKELVALAKCLSLHPSRIRAVFPHPSSNNLIVALHSVQDVVEAKTNRNAVLDVLKDDFKKLMITASTIPAAQQQDEATSSTSNQDIIKRISQGTITSAGNEFTHANYAKYDFVSRLFAPKIGIDEDHCSAASTAILAKLWASVLEEERFMHKKRLFAYQASPRGGSMILTISGKRVTVVGDAVIVASGEVDVLSSSSSAPNEIVNRKSKL